MSEHADCDMVRTQLEDAAEKALRERDSARAEVKRLREALEKWPCLLCNGKKEVPRWRYDGIGQDMVACQTCGATGIYWKAREAMAGGCDGCRCTGPGCGCACHRTAQPATPVPALSVSVLDPGLRFVDGERVARRDLEERTGTIRYAYVEDCVGVEWDDEKGHIRPVHRTNLVASPTSEGGSAGMKPGPSPQPTPEPCPGNGLPFNFAGAHIKGAYETVACNGSCRSTGGER